MNAVPQRATCAIHDGAVANATCARCGRFACDACLDGRNACRACAAQVLSASPVSRRGRWARYGLFAHAVVAGIMGVATFVRWVTGPVTAEWMGPAPVVWYIELKLVMALAGFVLLIATGIAFLLWTYSLVDALHQMKVELTDTPVSAILWWFVPLANLVKPYQNLHECLVQLRNEVLVDEVRLGWWWGLFIAGNLLGLVTDASPVGIASLAMTFSSALLGARLIRLADGALRDFATPEPVAVAPLDTQPDLPAATA